MAFSSQHIKKPVVNVLIEKVVKTKKHKDKVATYRVADLGSCLEILFNKYAF